MAKYLTTDATRPFGEFAISAPTAGGERLSFRLYDTSPAAGYDVDVAEPKPLTTGAVVRGSGWVPGLPLPLDDVLPELTAVLGQGCLVCAE